LIQINDRNFSRGIQPVSQTTHFQGIAVDQSVKRSSQMDASIILTAAGKMIRRDGGADQNW
jgi:hypothetical protein